MRKKETICIHPLGDDATSPEGVTSPILTSTAYNYTEGQELVYPGFFSTFNQKKLGEIISKLEGGNWGMAFNSGMSAIAAAIFSIVKAGDHVIFFNELYGGTWRFAKEELPQRGVSCSFASKDLSSFEAALQKNTRLVYLETPSNPLMSILNLQEIAAWAKKNQLLTVVDNTFATPINQKPLELGIDVVVHSGTKYLGGHNDMLFGALASNNLQFKKALLSTAKLYGGALSSFSCYLAERSIKTLSLRVERQNQNALKIAEYLEKHPKIRKVYYPGLPSHNDYKLAQKQMEGFGGMLSFETNFASTHLSSFLSHLSIIKPALSLGGVESLICVPALTSHVSLSKAEREQMGIGETLLRLSVGIENYQDLIEDLENALNRTDS